MQMAQLPVRTDEHSTRHWYLGIQLSLNQLTRNWGW